MPPFFEVPDARGCQTVGRSAIRQPRLEAVITTSAVWYWSWTRWGTMSSSTLDPEGPVAVGRVGQLLAGDGVDGRRRRGVTPARRNRSVVWSTPSRREAITKSAVSSSSGCEHGRHLGRVVLAVGVEGDHVAGAVGRGQPVAEPQGRALAQVDRQHAGVDPGVEGHLGGAVGAAVDHHQGGDLEVADEGRHGLQHVADVVLLLVGGDEGHHRAEPDARGTGRRSRPGPGRRT